MHPQIVAFERVGFRRDVIYEFASLVQEHAFFNRLDGSDGRPAGIILDPLLDLFCYHPPFHGFVKLHRPDGVREVNAPHVIIRPDFRVVSERHGLMCVRHTVSEITEQFGQLHDTFA